MDFDKENDQSDSMQPSRPIAGLDISKPIKKPVRRGTGWRISRHGSILSACRTSGHRLGSGTSPAPLSCGKPEPAAWIGHSAQSIFAVSGRSTDETGKDHEKQNHERGLEPRHPGPGGHAHLPCDQGESTPVHGDRHPCDHLLHSEAQLVE